MAVAVAERVIEGEEAVRGCGAATANEFNRVEEKVASLITCALSKSGKCSASFGTGWLRSKCSTIFRPDSYNLDVSSSVVIEFGRGKWSVVEAGNLSLCRAS